MTWAHPVGHVTVGSLNYMHDGLNEDILWETLNAHISHTLTAARLFTVEPLILATLNFGV